MVCANVFLYFCQKSPIFVFCKIYKVTCGLGDLKEYGVGIVMNAFRICLVGAARGPHIWNITDVLGKEETLHRVRTALAKLG